MSTTKTTLPKPLETLRRNRAWPEGVPLPPAGAHRGGARWTYEEEQQLRECYPKYGMEYVARLLGRSRSTVSSRASILGVTQPSSRAGIPRPWARKGYAPPPWTPEEDNQLHALHAAGQTPQQIAKAMKRMKIDVRRRSREIGVYRDQRQWSAGEEQLLRTLYGMIPNTELAVRLGRSVGAVVGHAAFIGIARHRATGPWTQQDDEQLRSLYEGMPKAEIARRMNRSEDAIILRAGRLGLTRKNTAPWDSDDDPALTRLHRMGMGYDAIARKLGRTRNAVSMRVVKLGLAKTQPMRAARWTEEEETTLRTLYGTIPNPQIAARLGRSPAAIGLKARDLRIVAGPSRPWTAEEDRFIALHYGTKSRQEIAETLDRTIPAITSRAGTIGVSRKRLVSTS